MKGRIAWQRFALASVLTFLGACQGSAGEDGPSPDSAAKSVTDRTTPSTARQATVEPVTAEQAASICKKAMAVLFGQSMDIMKAEQQPGDIIRISYRRASDRTLWTNDCRLDGNRIMWRSVDATPGSGPGRWRDDPADGLLSYTINGNDIEVVETY